jgi:uncharacterized protein
LRSKFDRYLSQEHRRRILDIVIIACERVELIQAVRACRDPKDDKYLALAASGHADVIVSGDVQHLLAMHPWRGISILRPADYLMLG